MIFPSRLPFFGKLFLSFEPRSRSQRPRSDVVEVSFPPAPQWEQNEETKPEIWRCVTLLARNPHELHNRQMSRFVSWRIPGTPSASLVGKKGPAQTVPKGRYDNSPKDESSSRQPWVPTPPDSLVFFHLALRLADGPNGKKTVRAPPTAIFLRQAHNVLAGRA